MAWDVLRLWFSWLLHGYELATAVASVKRKPKTGQQTTTAAAVAIPLMACGKCKEDNDEKRGE